MNRTTSWDINSAMENNGSAGWRKKVLKTRPISALLEVELFHVDLLYERLLDLETSLYDFERQNQEIFSFQAGEPSGYNSDENERLRKSRITFDSSIEEVKQEINYLITRRRSLISSEITELRQKQRFPKMSREKQKKAMRGLVNNIYELRRVLKSFDKLVDERERIFQLDLRKRKQYLRQKCEAEGIEMEKQRRRDNLHNFTNIPVGTDLKALLDRSGGFVQICSKTRSSQKMFLDFKRQAEEALLTYSCKVTGQKRRNAPKHHLKGRNKRISKRTVRSLIRANLSHPNLSRVDRQFIYYSLRLIGRYKVGSVKMRRSISSVGKGRRRDVLNLQNLKLFINRRNCILRESDKKLGWSVNSIGWYEREYKRQLNTDFYSRVGDVSRENEIKCKCRKELSFIVEKFKQFLGEKQIRMFNLGVVEDYTLPSLNLMPKVLKLTNPASVQNECQLTGRPIVTGHSWCTLEASRYLQQKFRELLKTFTAYLRGYGYQSTILAGSNDLLQILRKTDLKAEKNYCFVTFDFKDLYTNILFEDASKCLHEVAMLVGLSRKEIDFYLDLYKFCNEWNYFNVGKELFRQEKGISMGCYYSKEISELVLLYSEYKYQLVSELRKIEVLTRYADDALIFSTCNSEYVVKEMKKLMLFYPSNLIINVTVNRKICNYLDLLLSLDDVSDKYGVKNGIIM